MHNIYTLWERKSRALYALLVLLYLPFVSSAQFTVNANQTASALATTLTGGGVTIINPRLTCHGAANGKFTTGPISPIGIPYGIVLTTGTAKDTLGNQGIANPADDFNESSSYGEPGDAALSALAGGGVTGDACILEFDFKAAGDTIKFNYVFASEEYPEFACSEYNDVFGFLISGGHTAPGTSYPTPYNIARIPGTTIPVCINSVNSAPTGTPYDIADCNSLGVGSPFSAYYVDNAGSTLLVYDGMTTVLRAMAAVSPCDTYHLKLGIADVGDDAYNSGVFIQGGSLTSNVPTAVTSTGTSGLPYCIRNCAPGNFVFSIPETQDTVVTIHYTISGTAVNGYDYATIADSANIAIGSTSTQVDINTLLVPPAGPKTVILTIMIPDPCHPGVFSIGSQASLTILDSFSFRIVTPDTSICAGQFAQIRAVGDPIFNDILTYTWSPGATLSTVTILTTNATPAVTTQYTLTATTAPALGCVPQTKRVTVSIYPNPVLTIDSPLVKTCVGTAVQMHVSASPGATAYTYNWAPATYLTSTSASNPFTNPLAAGDITYTVTVYPTALPACASNVNITVHTLPNDFTTNSDTVLCIGESLQTYVNGPTEFLWHWTPPDGVSDVNAMTPVITPTVDGSYTVTASYAHCPDMSHSFAIEVDHPAPVEVKWDTVCVGMVYNPDLTVPGSTGIGSGYYHYQWAPPTYVSNDTLPNPTITPAMGGTYVYTVTVQPHAVACAVNDLVNLYVLPNRIDIVSPDTAVCKGQPVQVVATGHPLFTYQWRPTAGMANSDVVAPLITADTSAMYVITVSFHLCPDFYDSIMVDVQPNPIVHIGGNRFVCQYDTLRIKASITPDWYTHYSYSWTPTDAGVLDHVNDPAVVFAGNDTSRVIVTVSTPAGCKAVDSADVIVLPGDFASMVPNMEFCPHDTAILAPEGGVSYEWSPSLYIDDVHAARAVIRPITNQAYSVIATSVYGCRDTLSFTATVHPAAVLTLKDSVILYPGETYQIDLQTNCTRFVWSPPAGLDNRYVSNPLAAPEVSTKYIVEGTTEWGCKTKDSIKIHVDEESVLSVPNAFAPGSGPNKEFKIIKRGIATLNYFRIFNRWGNLIFETTDIDQGWNGEYKSVPQPLGVFVYELQAVTSTGKIFNKHGNITLLR